MKKRFTQCLVLILVFSSLLGAGYGKSVEAAQAAANEQNAALLQGEVSLPCPDMFLGLSAEPAATSRDRTFTYFSQHDTAPSAESYRDLAIESFGMQLLQEKATTTGTEYVLGVGDTQYVLVGCGTSTFGPVLYFSFHEDVGLVAADMTAGIGRVELYDPYCVLQDEHSVYVDSFPGWAPALQKQDEAFLDECLDFIYALSLDESQPFMLSSQQSLTAGTGTYEVFAFTQRGTHVLTEYNLWVDDPDRGLAFEAECAVLFVVQCDADGTVTLHSTSVDGLTTIYPPGDFNYTISGPNPLAGE